MSDSGHKDYCPCCDRPLDSAVGARVIKAVVQWNEARRQFDVIDRDTAEQRAEVFYCKHSDNFFGIGGQENLKGFKKRVKIICVDDE